VVPHTGVVFKNASLMVLKAVDAAAVIDEAKVGHAEVHKLTGDDRGSGMQPSISVLG
jgi:hypothetical protein